MLVVLFLRARCCVLAVFLAALAVLHLTGLLGGLRGVATAVGVRVRRRHVVHAVSSQDVIESQERGRQSALWNLKASLVART